MPWAGMPPAARSSNRDAPERRAAGAEHEPDGRNLDEERGNSEPPLRPEMGAVGPNLRHALQGRHHHRVVITTRAITKMAHEEEHPEDRGELPTIPEACCIDRLEPEPGLLRRGAPRPPWSTGMGVVRRERGAQRDAVVELRSSR